MKRNIERFFKGNRYKKEMTYIKNFYLFILDCFKKMKQIMNESMRKLCTLKSTKNLES